MSKQIRHYVFILTFIAALFTSPRLVATPTAQAATEMGYYWTLIFDFNNTFNGVLKLEVGPWENGKLLKVEQSSEARVACAPVGAVVLANGVATFNGNSYLTCTLDLAGAFKANHNLEPKRVESYGALLISARAQLNAAGNAPLFKHRNASFGLSAPGPLMVRDVATLTNNGALMQSQLFSLNWGVLQTYEANYSCAWGGACDMNLTAGPNQQTLFNQGAPVQFATGRTTFTIGQGLNGQIDALLVDPGNYRPPN